MGTRKPVRAQFEGCTIHEERAPEGNWVSIRESEPNSKGAPFAMSESGWRPVPFFKSESEDQRAPYPESEPGGVECTHDRERGIKDGSNIREERVRETVPEQGNELSKREVPLEVSEP